MLVQPGALRSCRRDLGYSCSSCWIRALDSHRSSSTLRAVCNALESVHEIKHFLPGHFGILALQPKGFHDEIIIVGLLGSQRGGGRSDRLWGEIAALGFLPSVK
jgi:hypothetical protein